MRSAPAAMVEPVAAAIGQHGRPDMVLATDMFDLPTWLGLVSRDLRFSGWFDEVPLVTYFHENQWAYPSAPGTPVDHHYGYTNLLTAAVSDECWFNSEFNRRSFLEFSRRFIGRMPDSNDSTDIDRIESVSRVLCPGFAPPNITSKNREAGAPIRLGWVGRFEHDKRPDRFIELLDVLNVKGVSFELILLGQRGRNCESLDLIQTRYRSLIRFDGYAETRQEYEGRLGEIDVVISTADHEFFGIAICESIWAGAVPVTPNRLSYVEYVPPSLRYDSIQQAAEIIAKLGPSCEREDLIDDCRSRIAAYRIDEAVGGIDSAVERLSTNGGTRDEFR